jgi:cytochrome bd ubiquinol oxidase subunit II
VPIGRDGEFTGTLFSLLTPYGLMGGVTTLVLFLAHGATFLSLRTAGDVSVRARAVAASAMPLAAAVVALFLGWSLLKQADRDAIEWPSAVLAALAVAAALGAAAMVRAHPLRAFALTSGAITALFASLFVDLYPDAMISSTDPRFTLSLAEAASTPYTLKVMTVVAVLFVPLVLLYQGWTYWVFRARITRGDYELPRVARAATSGDEPVGDATGH